MNRIMALILAAAFFLALAGTTDAQTSTAGQPTDEEWRFILDRVNLLVDNHFENKDNNRNLTGLSVGIYKNGRTAFFSRGFHESELRKVAKRRPVTENSIFAIGSISKPVSTIMLSYFSRINNPATGRPYVNLNDPVNNYFKTAPYIDTDGTQVHPTLLQFVTHRMGGATGGSSYTLAQLRSTLETLTYTSKPGTAYRYSSGSTVVANIIASLYYGRDFPQKRVNDLLLEQLFRPLGMNSTMIDGWLDPAMQDRMTLGHSITGAAMGYRPVPRGENLGGASGRITSTAPEMIRLASFIIGDNVPAGTEVLQQAAAAGIGWRSGNRTVPSTALSPHESNIEKLSGRFRELFGRPSNSGQRYGRALRHGGSIRGHNSYMIMCPDTKTAVVVLLNNRKARGSLAQQIIDRVLNATYTNRRTAFNDFDDLVATYNRANANVDIALTEDLTIEAPINHIRAPARAGVTLTIRSANPAMPVTLTRGTSGNLFTVPSGVTLIFRDIIIDGGGNILFSEVDDDDDDEDEEGEDEGADTGAAAEADEDGNQLTESAAVVAGTLVRVNSGGTFIMESGAVLRNNVNSGDGGGVFIARGGTFTMNSGEISGNTAKTSGGIMLRDGVFTMNNGKISGNTSSGVGGGVRAPVANGVFTMNGGEISGNSGAIGGGVRLSGRAAFTMTGGRINGNTAANGAGGGVAIANTGSVFTLSGGEISGNTASVNGAGVVVSSGTFNMNGGQIFGNNTKGSGTGVRRAGGTVNLNGGVVAGDGRNVAAVVSGTHHLNSAVPRNAVIIAWNRPAGNIPNYSAGANTNLTVSAGASASWQNQSGSLGVSYTNGSNTGWIRAW